MSSVWENNEEIKIFREYLRIPSVHPNIDYGNFLNFEKYIQKLNFVAFSSFQSHVWSF